MKMQPTKGLLHLAIIVIIASVHFGKADAEKYFSCCTAVSNQVVTDPIIGFKLQIPSREDIQKNHCVHAIILTTDKNENFCYPVHSSWVRSKIQRFVADMRSKRTSTASTLQARLTSPTPSSALRTDQSLTEGSAQ